MPSETSATALSDTSMEVQAEARSDAPDDAEIVRRVLNGDINAFSLLMTRHQRRVMAIARRHVRPEDTGEVCQEAFVRAWQSLARFQGSGSFRAWISAIAVRTSYDYWRRKYRNREMTAASLSEAGQREISRRTAEDAAARFEAEAERRDAAALLRRVLDRLSPEDRMVVELVHLEEKSVKEAAALLGWTAANVKIRAFRARKKLKKWLEREERSEKGDGP